MQPPGHDDENAVDALLDRVLASPEQEWSNGLERACEEHPEQALALRRRFAHLQRVGLVSGDGAFVLAAGATLGAYVLQGVLGTGGMGTVFRARRNDVEAWFAVKVLRPEFLGQERARERLLREGRLAAELQHDNLCPVVEVSEEQGVPYLVMPFVDGESLLDRLRRDPQALSGSAAAVRGTVAWFADVAAGLAVLHRRGLVHRDVKPANILIDRGGRPVLVDFGLAWSEGSTRLTVTGTPVGTPAYMPPEQVRGSTDVSPPADVYALGASLYECLAHRPPFSAGDRETLYRSILRDEPPDLRRFNQHVSRSLWAVVLRCLAKDPARRYHDGADLATELEALRAGMRVRARLPGPARHAARWLRRHPVAALLLVVSGLMATIAMLLAWQSNERVRAQAMAIVSGSAALDEVNPVAGALLAREAYRAADTFATRSRLLAALANLAQVGEVDFGKTVGWAGVSPDGKCVAAGVLPWAPLPEAPMIQGPWRLALSGRGHAGAWSGDGTRFALCIGTGVVTICDGESGEFVAPQRELRGPGGGARKIARYDLYRRADVLDWHADGMLLVGDTKGVVHVFDRDGTAIEQLPDLGEAIYGLRALPCGDLLVLLASGTVAQIDVHGTVRARREASSAGDLVVDSAFAKDRSCFSFGLRSGRLVLVRAQNLEAQVLGDLGTEIHAVAVSGSGSVAAAATDDRTVWLWEQGMPLRSLAHAADSVPSAMALDEGGHFLAVGDRHGVVRLFDRTLRFWRALRGHSGAVTSIWFTDDGHLLSTAFDGTLRRWRLRDDTFTVLWGVGGTVFGGEWLADGSVAAADYFGRVLQWDAAGKLWTQESRVGNGQPGFALAPTRDGIAISGGIAGPIRHALRSFGGTLEAVSPPSDQVPRLRWLQLLPDGRILGSRGNRMHLIGSGGWSTPVAESAEILSFHWSPVSERIAVASTEDLLRFFDLDGKEVREPVPCPADLAGIRWSPDGRWIACGAGNGAVWVLEPATGRTHVLLGHEGRVRQVAWLPDSSYLVSGAADGTARVWTAGGEPIAEVPHQGIVHHVAIHPDGTRFLTAGSDGAVRIWPMPVGDLSSLASGIFRGFTAEERERYGPLLR